jgi:hypothetical protein
MAGTRSARSWRNAVAASCVLLPVIGFVVYSSFQVSAVECEVCMAFEGRPLCRSASASTRDEALRSAADNACALLTSGMTNTIRCQRSEPVKTQCRPLDPAGGAEPTAPRSAASDPL